MTIKKLTSRFMHIVAGLFLAAGLAWAQPTFTATTLSAAIDSDDTTMSVASATGFTANTTVAQIDRELIRVRAISGTTISVIRGAFGSKATNHGNGSAVLVAGNANFGACGGTLGLVPCGYQYGPHIQAGPYYPGTFPVTITTAAAVTLTAGQVLSGLILRDPAGAARTDTLPTAALMVAAVPGATVGTTFEFTIRNDADAAETITVAAGTGGTISGTATIAQSNSKRFWLRFTRVDAGNEAYTCYSLGTVVH